MKTHRVGDLEPHGTTAGDINSSCSRRLGCQRPLERNWEKHAVMLAEEVPILRVTNCEKTGCATN